MWQSAQALVSDLVLWAEEADLFLPVSWPSGTGVLALSPQNTGLGEDGLWCKPAQDSSTQWGNGWCHLWGAALGLGTIIGILWSMVKCTHLVVKATGLHLFVSSCIQAWGCWHLTPGAIYLVQSAYLYLEQRSEAWGLGWREGVGASTQCLQHLLCLHYSELVTKIFKETDFKWKLKGKCSPSP